MSLTNSVDSGLMAKKQLTPEEQSQAAVGLKVARQPESESVGLGETIKQVQSLARNSGKQINAKPPAGAHLPSKANLASSAALKAAWLNIIDSFGGTLIYINFHAFGRFILGEKAFCSLGEEWIPQSMRSLSESPSVKSKIKKLALVEKMLLILVDAIVLLCLVIIAVMLIVVVKIMTNGFVENFKLILSILTGG